MKLPKQKCQSTITSDRDKTPRRDRSPCLSGPYDGIPSVFYTKILAVFYSRIKDGHRELSGGHRDPPLPCSGIYFKSILFSSVSHSMGLLQMYCLILFNSFSFRMIRSWKLRCHNLPANKCQPWFFTPSIYRLVVIDLNLAITSDNDKSPVGTGPRACPFSVSGSCPFSMSGHGRPRGAVPTARIMMIPCRWLGMICITSNSMPG